MPYTLHASGTADAQSAIFIRGETTLCLVWHLFYLFYFYCALLQFSIHVYILLYMIYLHALFFSAVQAKIPQF